MTTNNSVEQGNFSISRRKISVSNTADHNEIIISNSEWNYLCESVDKIYINKNINVPNILFGSILATSIGYITDYLEDSQSANFFPVFISIILWIICNFLIKHNIAKWLGPSNDNENTIHLEYVKNCIKKISSRKSC